MKIQATTSGDRLRQMRSSKGLNQQVLSKRTGVGQSSISDFENNKKSMAADSLYAITKELGVTLEWLLTGEDSTNIKKQQDRQPITEVEIKSEFFENMAVATSEITNYSINRFNKILIFFNKIEVLKKEGKLNSEHISIINVEFDDAIDQLDRSIEKIEKFLKIWCPSSEDDAQKTA